MGKRKRNHAYHIPYSSNIYRLGEALLDQQMWCWGCDVRYETGNLLLAYGFEQRRSPNPRFHSAYTYALCPECALTLWGWGVWIAAHDHGSLFINRDGFRLRWSSHTDLIPQAWQARDLPLTCDPIGNHHGSAMHLLTEAVTWIAGYERWLHAYTDATYREQVVAAWPQRRHHKGGVSAGGRSGTWAEFAESLRETGLKVTEL